MNNLSCILIDLYKSADIERGSISRVIDVFHAVKGDDTFYDFAGWNTPARLYVEKDDVDITLELCNEHNLIVIKVEDDAAMVQRMYMFA